MKVLAIGAHFDDIELGCGGTLLKHKQAGDEIYLLVVTHSGYTSSNKKWTRQKEQAKSEGEESAKALGATLICCEKAPHSIVQTEELILELEEIINNINPDRVYTHQPNDSHADHSAIGYCSIRACRKCSEVMLYRSNWYIMDNAQDDNYYVNISAHIEKKMELMRIFKSEMEQVNYSWVDFVKKQNSASGAKINVSYVETFHIMKKVWG
jgi:LmbE family N-acetylglucosaminyl deacetylase